MIKRIVAIAAALILISGLGTAHTEAATSKKQVTASNYQRGKLKRKQYSARRDCGSFFHCMFRGSGRGNFSSGFSIGGGTRQVVDWRNARYKPGSIVVRTPERRLYYVLPGGKAMRYSVGVGKEGFQWGGVSRVARKAVWPDWRPPRTMVERERRKGHFIPEHMEGGPGNPLGARALYIGGTLFRIHGTNNAASIGGAVSSGCIRMMNADVIDLYERARIGARVYVYQ